MPMRVSLCMIARNEAATLSRCLGSAAGLAEEIIVVDTGSLDNTREIARDLNAQVHEFPWVDDFAAARNESLRHATGDWILWLDGDEYFDAANRAQLRTLVDNLADENAAFLMTQRSPVAAHDDDSVVFQQCRLFRNLPAIRWQYRVHEQIQPAVERSGGTVRPTGITIEHSGYQDAALYRRKLERNLRLLLLEDHERPGDAFTLMNLGWAYKDLGQIPTALEYYERSLARCSPGQSIVPKLYRLIVRGHHALGGRRQAIEACRAGRALYPDDVELSFLEAVLLSELGELPAAEALLLKLLEEPPAVQSAIIAPPGMRGHMARHNLARLYRAQGRHAEAEAQWRLALDERPLNLRSLYELGLLYLQQGRTTDTEPLIDRLRTLGPLGDLAATMLSAQVHLQTGNVALARSMLEQTIAAMPKALEPRLMLARLLVTHSPDRRAAEATLRGVLALEPNHVEARRALGALLEKPTVRQSEAPPPETRPVEPFTRGYYISIHQGAHRSAKEVVPHVLELVRPSSVVDVGCGAGSWLSVFRDHGITDVLGIDGENMSLDLLQIPRDQFLTHDLTEPLVLGRRFDLALSLEVAEHLSPESAALFTASLVRLAPVILFSAAVPYQGGQNHLNEQWPEYWITHFERHGYLVLDCLRDRVWQNERVDWWYAQNMLLFCAPEVLVQNPTLRRELANVPAHRLALVHPRLFLQAVAVIQELRRQLEAPRSDQGPAPGQ